MIWIIVLIIVLAIGLWLIGIAIQYWYVTLGLAGVGLVVYLVLDAQKTSQRRQAADAERRAAEAARQQRHAGEQVGYRQQMAALAEQSISLFELMPKHLNSAEQYLDQADVDFRDGAFAPFWDSIESAAKTLGGFVESVRQIKTNSSRYIELITKYEDTPPKFRLDGRSVAKLSVGTETAERMKSIVRAAQPNFQFATIYEQRKTNQILVAGFTNLAQALDRMTRQISASIDDLANSIDGMASTLDESMRTIHSRIDEAAQESSQRHAELMKEASHLATREGKALEMLDNIQRGRRPTL